MNYGNHNCGSHFSFITIYNPIKFVPVNGLLTKTLISLLHNIDVFLVFSIIYVYIYKNFEHEAGRKAKKIY